MGRGRMQVLGSSLTYGLLPKAAPHIRLTAAEVSTLPVNSSTSSLSPWMWAVARKMVLGIDEGLSSPFFLPPINLHQHFSSYRFAFLVDFCLCFWGDRCPTSMSSIPQWHLCFHIHPSEWETVTMAVRRPVSKAATTEINPAALIQFLAWQNPSEDKESFNWLKMSGSNNEHGHGSWNLFSWICSRLFRGVSDIWQH